MALPTTTRNTGSVQPNEAIPFWQRMNRLGGARPPEFLSTHPAPETRIEQIREYLPEALGYYEG